MHVGMMNVSAALYAAEQAERIDAAKNTADLRKRLRKAIDDLDAGLSTEADAMADTWKIGRKRDVDNYRPGY
jgi:hypothetical protein